MLKIKYINFLLPILFTLIFSNAIAESKIAFVQMELIIKESIVGKSLINDLEKINKKNQKFFQENQKQLTKKKKEITDQKNILSKEEFEKKVISINLEFEKYKTDSQKKIKLLEKKRNDGMNQIIKELNILLAEYSDQNKLDFIIDQKFIVIGKTDYYITDKILKKLDSKIKKIK